MLAKIFRNFYDCYNNDNQRADERTREELLDRFQKVYRYVSLINNQKQMLDDEFDYEGNISKLTKQIMMGQSKSVPQNMYFQHFYNSKKFPYLNYDIWH